MQTLPITCFSGESFIYLRCIPKTINKNSNAQKNTPQRNYEISTTPSYYRQGKPREKENATQSRQRVREWKKNKKKLNMIEYKIAEPITQHSILMQRKEELQNKQ